jgi:hypothetical protein
VGFFHEINHPAIGVPPFMEPPWINGLVLLGKLKPESPMIFMIFMGKKTMVSG